MLLPFGISFFTVRLRTLLQTAHHCDTCRLILHRIVGYLPQTDVSFLIELFEQYYGDREEKQPENPHQLSAHIHGDQSSERIKPYIRSYYARLDYLTYYRDRQIKYQQSDTEEYVAGEKIR